MSKIAAKMYFILKRVHMSSLDKLDETLRHDIREVLNEYDHEGPLQEDRVLFVKIGLNVEKFVMRVMPDHIDWTEDIDAAHVFTFREAQFAIAAVKRIAHVTPEEKRV